MGGARLKNMRKSLSGGMFCKKYSNDGLHIVVCMDES